MKKVLAGLAVVLAAIAICASEPARAEDGYDLWLRYRPLAESAKTALAGETVTLVTGSHSPTLDAAQDELMRGLSGLLGAAPSTASAVDRDGAIIVGTPTSLPLIASLGLPLDTLGTDGYLIRSVQVNGRRATVIAAQNDLGVLYGTYAFLRRIQTGESLSDLDVSSSPKLGLRILDHWDNLTDSVERGYAGSSIWDWWTLPDYVKPLYRDYARANASIGINGTVLNNVNATPNILRHEVLVKAAKLAEVFRPYGLKVYLSVNFATPIALGGLKTADPLDPQVQQWWKDKADEIYALIPDFGGFLVKASAEGQPGPGDYGRSHADGANMLADALAPHGGIVMWRAFVYSDQSKVDRAAQALNEFKPLDGQFHDNVTIWVKNGPIDFQPREAFSPLFGAMQKTPLTLEVQITKEYLGQATHLVYLGALWQEVLDADTYARGKGSTVASVIEGKVWPQKLTGMAGVSNIGTDRDWTNGIFNQANWYAMGRLAWDHEADARAIAAEWAAQTFTPDPAFVKPVEDMMMISREAVVNYMTPLGLHHQMASGHHYGPGPWVANLKRPEWNPVYYSKADANGIGFDRTATGTNAIAQYAPEVQAQFGDPHALDEKYLLWFHHEPWDYRISSGETLWDSLVEHYDLGVAQVAGMQQTWERMKPYVDPERFGQVAAFLAIQHREAQWWRDASISYFQSLSKQPLPAGHAEPPHDLAYYESLQFPYAPGQSIEASMNNPLTK
jgi:alpha-glucuronidase